MTSFECAQEPGAAHHTMPNERCCYAAGLDGSRCILASDAGAMDRLTLIELPAVLVLRVDTPRGWPVADEAARGRTQSPSTTGALSLGNHHLGVP
jgi:hypothetical protein